MPSKRARELMRAFMGHFQEGEDSVPLALRHEASEVVFTALLDEPGSYHDQLPMLDGSDDGPEGLGIQDEVDQMLAQAQQPLGPEADMMGPDMMDPNMDIEGMMGPQMGPGMTPGPDEDIMPNLDMMG